MQTIHAHTRAGVASAQPAGKHQQTGSPACPSSPPTPTSDLPPGGRTTTYLANPHLLVPNALDGCVHDGLLKRGVPPLPLCRRGRGEHHLRRRAEQPTVALPARGAPLCRPARPRRGPGRHKLRNHRRPHVRDGQRGAEAEEAPLPREVGGRAHVSQQGVSRGGGRRRRHDGRGTPRRGGNGRRAGGKRGGRGAQRSRRQRAGHYQRESEGRGGPHKPRRHQTAAGPPPRAAAGARAETNAVEVEPKAVEVEPKAVEVEPKAVEVETRAVVVVALSAAGSNEALLPSSRARATDSGQNARKPPMSQRQKIAPLVNKCGALL